MVWYHVPEIGCRNKRVPDSNIDSFSVGVEKLLEILEKKVDYFPFTIVGGELFFVEISSKRAFENPIQKFEEQN